MPTTAAAAALVACLVPPPHNLVQDIRPWWDSIVKTLDYNVGLARFAGPHLGWNDLDSERG